MYKNQMDPSKVMKEKLKLGFQRFSAGTSMHGYQELYTAKSMFWTFFWIVVVGASVGLTTFHVVVAVRQFQDQPTTTVLSPAKDEDIMYPPLRLCYTVWIQWVDWSKVTSLNCSKATFLHGMNFFNVIYNQVDFNETEAAANFTQLMKQHKFSTVFDFYKYIARKVPISADDDFEDYFNKLESAFKSPGYMFCYRVTFGNMFTYFHSNNGTGDESRRIQFSIFDESFENFRNFVSPIEYSAYMRRWVNAKSKYALTTDMPDNALSNFSPTISFYPNAFSDKSIDIMSENYGYDVDLAASAFTWKNKESKVCVEGAKAIKFNVTCELACQAEAERNGSACRCLNTASILNDDLPDNLCQRGIKFINESTGLLTREAATDATKIDNRHCATFPLNNPLYNNCIKKCIIPCQVWSYSASVSVNQMYTAVRKYGTKGSTNIYITYPESTNIVTMTEVVSQTWDQFLGNIGGLLGIWTGASILSFIQLFYLCCCVECSCFECPTFFKHDSNSVVVANNPPIHLEK